MWVLQTGHSGDGSDLAPFCVSIICRGRFVCSELGNGATNEAGQYLFRAANVCWRCAQYFVIASCG